MKRRKAESAAEKMARKQWIFDELKAIAHTWMVDGAEQMNAGRMADGHRLLSAGTELGKLRLDLLQGIADRKLARWTRSHEGKS